MNPLVFSNLEKSVLTVEELALFSKVTVPPSLQAALLRNQRSNRFLDAQSKIEKFIKSYQHLFDLLDSYRESHGHRHSEEEIAEHRLSEKRKRELRAEKIRAASLKIIKILMFFLKKCVITKRFDHRKTLTPIDNRKIIEAPSIDEEAIINVVMDKRSLYTLIILGCKRNLTLSSY